MSDGIFLSLKALLRSNSFPRLPRVNSQAPREPPFAIGAALKPDERAAAFPPRRSHCGKIGQFVEERRWGAPRAF
jgi:hypothetical protein